MRTLAAATVVALFAMTASVPAMAEAADPWVCPDGALAPLHVADGKAEQKCQKVAAKMGSKFVKVKLKASGKCLSKQTPGLCPTAKDTQKVEKIAGKVEKKIGRNDKVLIACGTESKVMKYKKAEPLLNDGWVLVEA